MDLLEIFGRHFGLGDIRRGVSSVPAIVSAFARLPYENLTKIVKHDDVGSVERSKRGPRVVIEDHIRQGTGGTCFSLTNTLRELLRAANVEAQPILADRHYGSDTHCALVLWIEGQPCLVDPGFLVCRPLPLDGTEQRCSTSFNRVRLVPEDQGRRIHLHTVQQANDIRRLTFKWPPADDTEFHRAWDASFGWDMMRYPIVTSANEQGQSYLQGCSFQRRDLDGVERSMIDPRALVDRVAAEFAVKKTVVANALDILERRGETLVSD